MLMAQPAPQPGTLQRLLPGTIRAALPAGSPWTLVMADGIDAQGRIVGVGLLDGAPHRFRLTLPTMRIPQSDINRDGVVDSQDLVRVLSAFGLNDPAMDIDGDGVVNSTDLRKLLNEFGAKVGDTTGETAEP